jgi:ribosomal protein L37AE/L43A
VAAPNRFLEDSSVRKITVDAGGQQACPKCRSKETATAAKKPTANSYWRCLKCGEVWNPSLAGARQWWQR